MAKIRFTKGDHEPTKKQRSCSNCGGTDLSVDNVDDKSYWVCNNKKCNHRWQIGRGRYG